MADKVSNVVLNFKMSGQVEYAKTIRDINAIMNAAAAEYKTHIAAMGKDVEVTQKLAAEKKKLEIQLDAARERTKMLRAEYEAMAKDTNTTAGQLANKYKQLQNSERAELALAQALEKVNEELSEQAIEARKNQEALEKLESEAEALEVQTEKLNAEFELQQAQLGENASETEKLSLKLEHLEKAHELAGQQVENYEKQLELAKKQYGENSTEAQKYETKLIEAKTAEKQLANEINKTNEELKKQQDVLKQTSDKLQEASDKMKDIGKDMSMKVTAPIVAAGGASAKAAIDFESAFAGVRKTVDATEEQFAELEEGIRNMSKELPASATEIAGVAEAAGQLGIETDSILKFTRTVIDLGESTNLSLDQAATEFARFANIVGMSQKDFDRLGSSVVSLGNNFATTEAEIVAMGMRLAAQGKQVGMSEAQIMALAATMSSLGIEAEAGGTAMTTVLKKIQTAVGEGGKSLDGFAKAAGVSSKEFKQAWENDPIVALDMFIKGLAKSSEEGANLTTILADLGIKGVRESDTILRMAGASDLLAEAVKNSTVAWEENTALSNEAAQRYETTASQLQMFKNELTDLAIDIGEIIIPVLLDLIDAVRPWIQRLKESSDATKKFVVAIAAIMAAIGPLLMIIGSMATGLGVIIKGVSKVVQWFGGWSKIAGGLRTALTALTGPIGIIIAVITALIAIGIAIYKNWDTIKEKAIALKDAIVKNFNELKEKVINFFGNLVDAALELREKMIEKLVEIGESIAKFFTETIPEAFNNLVTFFQELPGKILEFLYKLFVEDIPYAIGYGIGWMINTVSNGIENTVTFFKELPGRIWEFLTEAIENLVNWALETREKAIEAGKNFLNNVVNFFKELPGRIWQFLSNAYSRIRQWGSNTKERAIEAGKNFLNNLINFFKQLPGRIWNFLKDAVSKMIQFASEMRRKAIETGKNVFNSIVDEIKKLPGRLLKLGSDIINGLVNGVKNSIKKVVNLAKDIASNFLGGFKKALGIKSPSRVMMEIGRFIMEGLGIGIENMGEYAVDKTVNVARSVTDAMKDGIEIPKMEIGAVVRQPQFNTTATSPMTAISNIGTNIRESLQGLSGEITVHVYLDSKQLNAQLAPGMSVELNNMNKLNARSKGVVVV